MANTGAPNSGGSQMFMNVVHNDFLDWFSPGESKHPVFGKAIDQASFDKMVMISKVPTKDDVPKTPIQVTSVTIDLSRLLAEPTAQTTTKPFQLGSITLAAGILAAAAVMASTWPLPVIDDSR